MEKMTVNNVDSWVLLVVVVVVDGIVVNCNALLSSVTAVTLHVLRCVRVIHPGRANGVGSVSLMPEVVVLWLDRSKGEGLG